MKIHLFVIVSLLLFSALKSQSRNKIISSINNEKDSSLVLSAKLLTIGTQRIFTIESLNKYIDSIKYEFYNINNEVYLMSIENKSFSIKFSADDEVSLKPKNLYIAYTIYSNQFYYLSGFLRDDTKRFIKVWNNYLPIVYESGEINNNTLDCFILYSSLNKKNKSRKCFKSNLSSLRNKLTIK